jgi:hypothetical protein
VRCAVRFASEFDRGAVVQKRCVSSACPTRQSLRMLINADHQVTALYCTVLNRSGLSGLAANGCNSGPQICVQCLGSARCFSHTERASIFKAGAVIDFRLPLT